MDFEIILTSMTIFFQPQGFRDSKLNNQNDKVADYMKLESTIRA